MPWNVGGTYTKAKRSAGSGKLSQVSLKMCSGCLTVSQFQKARSLVSGRLVHPIVVVVSLSLCGNDSNDTTSSSNKKLGVLRPVSCVHFILQSDDIMLPETLLQPIFGSREGHALNSTPHKSSLKPMPDAEQHLRCRHKCLHTLCGQDSSLRDASGAFNYP